MEEKKKMGVAKGTMGVIPAHLSEQFLACFKGPGVDREKLKEMSVHNGKNVMTELRRLKLLLI